MPDRILGERCLPAGWLWLLLAGFALGVCAVVAGVVWAADGMARMLEAWECEA